MDTVYTKKKETPKNFLDSIVGDAKRKIEYERVDEAVSAGNVEQELRLALQVGHFHALANVMHNHSTFLEP